GNPETTAVTEEGAIALPPEVRDRFSDAAATFGAAAAHGDEVFVSRVDDGQVVGIDAAGKSRNVYKAEEAMVTALLATDDGLFVAVGTPARIYRIDWKGKASLFNAPDANYVWGMVEGPEHGLYAVTGEPGTVVKIDAKGVGKTLFKSEQAHLKSLAYDAKLGLFVGGGERGVVYRAQKETDFKALYDSGNPEVTALLVRDAYAYVAGVTGAASLASDEGGGKKSKAQGEVHSQLMRIAMDGTSEVLAGSSDEAVFALAFDARGQVIVATGATGRDDPRGRLYSIDPEKKLISMLYQSPSRRITHLVTLGKGALAAVAAGGGRITQLTRDVAHKGEFYTLPFDTGINSKLGLVQVLGSYPSGTSVEASVRTGQTAEPDSSWSDWSKPVTAPGNKPVSAPNGRYLQVRLTLKSTGEASPQVLRLRVAYLRQNLPPFVREVSTLRKGVALLPIPHDENKSKTVALADKGEERSSEEGRRTGQARARQVMDRGALTIKWLADDPNGDELKFELLVRGAGEATWRTLKNDLDDPFYTLKSSQLPDGHYHFKVRASDGRSNPDGMERSDSRESRAVLVDNTPPKVERLKASVSGRRATIESSVEDAVGPLVELTYALDSAEARPILPEDGILDGPGETFKIALDNLAPGRHTLTVRAVDEADNEGFG
ncbi:MAG TPA: fibronectin type III domain-containing protein, partial [Myxococcota bacterium]|nr:fibronectin type III domain-containing protein [Myxococcota bacterium]